MNLAIGTLLFFVFLLPGFVFRRFYYSEEFSKENIRQTFAETFLVAFIPSILLHTIWFYLSQIWGGVDLVLLARMLNEENCLECYQNLQLSANKIVLYNATIAIGGGLTGTLFKKTVRRRIWDRRFKIFRFQNSWHYLLKGEFFDFPRASFNLERDVPNQIELVYVDLLINTNEGTIIYDGILVDYELNKDSGLDYITLKEVQRRFLKSELEVENGRNARMKSSNSEYYYNIPGHLMVFRYETVINLNLTFFKVRRSSDENGDLSLSVEEVR